MRYEISASGKLIGELRAPPSFDLFARQRRDRAASSRLRLYRRHNSPLRLSVAGNVALRGGKARVTGKLLDVSQTPATLDDLACHLGDEGTPA